MSVLAPEVKTNIIKAFEDKIGNNEIILNDEMTEQITVNGTIYTLTSTDGHTITIHEGEMPISSFSYKPGGGLMMGGYRKRRISKKHRSTRRRRSNRHRPTRRR